MGGFNTQPPEGGWKQQMAELGQGHVSTHSRPKAAAQAHIDEVVAKMFQHTAARRRLSISNHKRNEARVSTHSRPKAAEPLSKALLHQVSQP